MARILIAEDDAHISRVMSIWLTRHGHEAICAADGRQALAAMAATPVDLVISDMNMPTMDGLTFVQELRKVADPRLPVIILSARCDQQELMDTLSSYSVTVYPKPFLPSYMVGEIHRLLGLPAQPHAEPVT